MDRYDLLVIGGRLGGPQRAQGRHQDRARVALVDSGPLGGTCVNHG